MFQQANAYGGSADHKYALEAQTVPYLKKLLAAVNPARKASSKSDLVAAILKEFSGDGLHRLWSRLDTLQQAAIREAVHGHTLALDLSRFDAKYGDLPDFGVFSSWGSLEEPSLLAAFLFNGRMPDDLRELLKAFVPAPDPATISILQSEPTGVYRAIEVYDPKSKNVTVQTQDLPFVIDEREHAAQDDLRSVLRVIGSNKLTVSDTTFMPSAATARVIANVLEGGDYYENGPPVDEEIRAAILPIKPIGWLLMLQAAKLVELSGKRPVLTALGQKALSAPPAESIKLLWDRWVDNTRFDELRRINAIKGQTGAGAHALTSPKTRRQAIVAALKECPPGTWFQASDFWRYVLAADHNFQVTIDPWTLYLNYAGNPIGEGRDAWQLLQGRYIHCLLFEYAATLGLIDITYVSPVDALERDEEVWIDEDSGFISRYDGLFACRITPLGAYCLGLQSEYQARAQTKQALLRVLPNRDIVVVRPPIPKAESLILDLFAVKSSELVWRLDHTRMLSAMEEGHPLADLRSLLDDRSEAALPDAVARFINEIEARGAKLKDRGPSRLIESNDPDLVTLIANDPRTRPHCVRAGERHLVVPESSERAFRKALRQLGYILPK